MNNQTIMCCVVSLLLGMLLFHMLKGVCGCKLVEGQSECNHTSWSAQDSVDEFGISRPSWMNNTGCMACMASDPNRPGEPCTPEILANDDGQTGRCNGLPSSEAWSRCGGGTRRDGTFRGSVSQAVADATLQNVQDAQSVVTINTGAKFGPCVGVNDNTALEDPKLEPCLHCAFNPEKNPRGTTFSTRFNNCGASMK